MPRGEGAGRPVAGEELSFTLAGVRPLPRQDRFQRSVQDDAVHAGLGAAYASVDGVIVVSDEPGDEDASGRCTQPVNSRVRDVDAGVVPAWRDLMSNAFVIGDQDSGGADDKGVPLHGAERENGDLMMCHSSSPMVLMAVLKELAKDFA